MKKIYNLFTVLLSFVFFSESQSQISTTVTASPGIICANSSSILQVTASLSAPVYCQPIYSIGSSSGDYIDQVDLNTLTNLTGANPSPYYTLYPQSGTTTTMLSAGSTYSLIVKTGTYSNNDVAGWIDFNQNGILNDATEKLGEIDNLGVGGIATLVFTVPAGALNGTTTLRIREMDHAGTSDMDPCLAQASFGETEDYKITITGGVSPSFTYSWSPAAFLSSASGPIVSTSNATVNTVYTVTVTSSGGATTTAVKTVSVYAPPIITVTSGTICSGNPFTIVSTGAVSYAYSGGSAIVNPMTTTVYSVVGTNSLGCTSLPTNCTVTVNASPNVTLTVTGATFGCPTSTLTNLMTASGANTYSWSTGVTTATINPTTTLTTVYSVEGTALNGCKNIQSSTILISNPPVLVTSSKNPLCVGEPFATLTASGASSYTWSTASTNTVINVTPATTTNYTLSGTVGPCSASVVFTQSVSVCTSIENLYVTDSEISIYPNPNNGILNIAIATNLVSNTSLLIYDALGKIVVKQVLLNEISTINIIDLDNGIYVYKVIDKTNIIKIGKLIKH